MSEQGNVDPRQWGVTGEVRVLPVAVPTAADAARELGCAVGAIVNSLVFAADGAPVLVLASGAHRVDTSLVAAQLGAAKVRRASPELVHVATGQRVGGVAPLGHPRPLPTLVDQHLADYPQVWAGGGDEYTMFATTYPQLLALTGGQPLRG
ncbi:YbaK/EbsC family protein [Solwaraspora sp. WMMA2056]|uniref:YbaK/EbsC family protein n=1 Tax=Solwaraspora sp. WMMA2056 TaxID=3015161 RepID=UPI00259B87A5|nr:YbaK/EbsC family protein [Solwaraspora sp. WMMA2056]WJK39428.1 YbaK/EbsC family protein [Solwaraspora sp. WMMA2056]